MLSYQPTHSTCSIGEVTLRKCKDQSYSMLAPILICQLPDRLTYKKLDSLNQPGTVVKFSQELLDTVGAKLMSYLGNSFTSLS